MAFLWKIRLNPYISFAKKGIFVTYCSKINFWIEHDFPQECHFVYLLVFHACFYLDTFWSCELFHFSGRPTLPGIDAGEMKKTRSTKKCQGKNRHKIRVNIRNGIPVENQAQSKNFFCCKKSQKFKTFIWKNP